LSFFSLLKSKEKENNNNRAATPIFTWGKIWGKNVGENTGGKQKWNPTRFFQV
jgi:hypothetical protein